MSVTNIKGNDFELAVSPTLHDGAAAELTTLHFPLSSGNALVANEPQFYTDENMANANAWGREVAPVPDRLRFARSFGADFYPEIAAHQMYYCGATGAAVANETFAGTGIYKHSWSGPRANTAVINSYTMEQSARPVIADSDYNIKNHNVVTSQVVIQGSRDSRVITISCDVVGGGDYTGAGAGGSGTETKSRFLTFEGSAYLVTSTNLGISAGKLVSGFTAAPTLAQMVTDSYLGGAPDADFTRAMHDFTLTMTQPINVDGSYTAGALDTGGAGVFGIIENNSMWIPSGPQDATLSFTLNENDTDGTTDVGALATEANAGTMRGWELWIVSPADQSANGTAAFPGIKFTMPNCSADPMTQSDNMSSNTRTFTYKPHFLASTGMLFTALTASKIAVTLGG